MENYKNICVIIPCRNEEGCIKGVLEDLARNLPGATKLVIDDASTDGTMAEALSENRAQVLSMPVNVGVGGALQAGFAYALKSNFELAVKFDGDGQHKADEIPALLETMKKEGADVVAGSRFLDGVEGYQSTALRRFGIALLNLAIRVVSGQSLTDCTSGFRLYNRRAMKALYNNSCSFDYPEPEEAVVIRKSRLKLVETPAEMKPRQAGTSSINSLKSAYFMLKMLLCIVMAALRAPKRG